MAAVLAVSIPAGPGLAAEPFSWQLLPEMENPPGVVVDAPEVRAALAGSTEAGEAISAAEAAVRENWRRLREVDWVGLSRRQIEATEGWMPPPAPGPLVGRVLGRDAAGRLHVEVRGPRLPARYDIVFRYVYVFATWNPLTGEVADLVVTIRGWIEE